MKKEVNIPRIIGFILMGISVIGLIASIYLAIVILKGDYVKCPTCGNYVRTECMSEKER